MKNFKRSLAVGLMATSFGLSAQFQSAQLLNNIPQYQLFGNPSQVSNERFHLLLPGLSGVNVAGGHTAFALNDAIEGSTIQVDQVLASLKDENNLWTDVRVPVFQIGLKTGSIFWRAGIAGRVQTRLAYPGDLLELAWKGNGHPDLIGRRLDFDGFEIHGSSIVDYYLGAAVSIPTIDLTVGGNVHYLAGIAAVHTENSAFGLTTNATDYAIKADGTFDVYTAGIGDLDNDEFNFDAGQLFPGSTNHGMSFDLGLTAAVNGYRIKASANNMGWMKWRDQSQRYSLSESEFTFSGFDVADFVQSPDSVDEVLQQFADSLTNAFPVIEGNGEFRTSTNAAYQLTVSREFWEGGSLYLGVNQNRRFGIGLGGVHAGVVQHFREWLRLQAGLQWFNKNQVLVSTGLSTRLGPCMLFAQVEHLPAVFSPIKHRTWQGSVGFALKFGRLDKVNIQPVEAG